MAAAQSYTVTAVNLATDSDNKVHDDDIAQKLGFTGGLVPGVDVYAYMSRNALDKWGERFFTHGKMSARFTQPVYDGDLVEAIGEDDGAAGLNLSLFSPDDTRLCASGHASLADDGEAQPDPLPTTARLKMADRPPAGAASLPEGLQLGTMQEMLLREEAGHYQHAIGDHHPAYDNGRITHPGYLLRRANFVLAYHVKLGPWIHVSSDMRFWRPLLDGESFETRAKCVATFEKGGHLFTTLDVQIHKKDGPDQALVMSGRHTAIIEPKQLRSPQPE